MLWEGDNVLVRTVAEQNLAAASRAVRALSVAVRAASMPEVLDVVPAARTVTTILRAAPSEALRNLLQSDPDPEAIALAAHHVFGVTYDGEDLDSFTDITRDQVVALHTAATYTVAFLGFAPGFPYLLGLPDALHAARLTTPRARVPAGSVGIGGAYTGIYPNEGPGGWRLLGRTDEPLFDATHGARLAPGDTVRFEAR